MKNRIDNIFNNYSIKELKTSALNISNKYRSNNGSGKALVNNNKDAISYALSRMPATIAANEFVLNDFINLTGYNPKTIIDVGSGTGASSIAVNNLFKCVNLTLVEREESMLSLSKEFVKDAEFIKRDVTSSSFDVVNKYDVVISSYVLNELNENEREIALNNLINLTNDYLIIIDPGTPKNYKQMMEIRDILLMRGMHLIAPCPHENKCPLSDGNDWCHFIARVNRTHEHRVLKNGTLSYEDEKFTYLIFSKIHDKKCNSRVIRHPIFRKKVVDLKLCTKEGIKELSITKSNEKYKQARDIKQGDNF